MPVQWKGREPYGVGLGGNNAESNRECGGMLALGPVEVFRATARCGLGNWKTDQALADAEERGKRCGDLMYVCEFCIGSRAYMMMVMG